MKTEVTISKSPREALEKYVKQLHDRYERWYAHSTTRVGITWQILQVLSYVSGFAAAIVAAVGPESWKTARVILPLIGSFAASLIVQLRLYELTQVREQGRIAFQKLSEDARCQLAAAKDEDCSKIHAELAAKAHEIEVSQTSLFFGLHKRRTSEKE